jgi:hypothetical protein
VLFCVFDRSNKEPVVNVALTAFDERRRGIDSNLSRQRADTVGDTFVPIASHRDASILKEVSPTV